MPILPDVSLALLAVLPLGAVELAKAARWAALFGPRRPPYGRCLRALVSGQLANALVPVRAGEAVQLGWLAAEGGALVPAAASLAGVKAIDAIGLGLIAAAVAGGAVLAGVGAWLLGVAAVLLAAALLAWREVAVHERLERALRRGARLEVVASLKDRRTLLAVAGSTAVVWMAGLGANAVVLAAAGIAPRPELTARVLVAGYLVGFLPAPPARLGVFEGGVTLALTSAGVGLPEAAAASLTLHACQLAELGALLAGSLLVRRWRWSA